MRIYKILNKTKISLVWLLTGSILAFLLIFPKESRNGATNGVFLCLQVLIPSLFPFMVLSSYTVESGLSDFLPEWINKTTQLIFKLPGCCSCVILLSLIGGYPVGASGIKSLWKQKLISKTEAQRMAMFCVASGPGFLVTYIGAVMVGNLKTGYILLVSQTISVLILSGISRLFFSKTVAQNNSNTVKKELRLSHSLIPAVTSAVKNSTLMCALVILFSAASEILITLTKDNPSVNWIVALFEITNGVKILSQGYPAVFMSAACGFGGLCVHFQILSQLRGIGVPKTIFLIFRVFQGILSSFCTYILLKIFPVSVTVFSTIEKAQGQLNNTTAGCIVLVICCCAFLFSLKNTSTTRSEP